ncbi:hypothetical protein AGR4C_pa70046 [Agrobacterium tumefaciens str. Kerr 14]|uniref:Uncharacterized protein n=1 Tax=Agrobacterium tumefaciens str. Kerr 14 TaxID=1183424 RepID=A0A1S7SCC0_AGRTU|nr:hypothetical protein AGR4C_pa70046 [Agrobacterium tumefaciens str. Kerr 14]
MFPFEVLARVQRCAWLPVIDVTPVKVVVQILGRITTPSGGSYSIACREVLDCAWGVRPSVLKKSSRCTVSWTLEVGKECLVSDT